MLALTLPLLLRGAAIYNCCCQKYKQIYRLTERHPNDECYYVQQMQKIQHLTSPCLTWMCRRHDDLKTEKAHKRAQQPAHKAILNLIAWVCRRQNFFAVFLLKEKLLHRNGQQAINVLKEENAVLLDRHYTHIKLLCRQNLLK